METADSPRGASGPHGSSSQGLLRWVAVDWFRPGEDFRLNVQERTDLSPQLRLNPVDARTGFNDSETELFAESGITIGQHDHAGLEGRNGSVQQAIGKVGRVQQAERRRRERVLSLASLRGGLDECR